MNVHIVKREKESSDNLVITTLLLLLCVFALFYFHYSDPLIKEEDLIQSSGTVSNVATFRRKGYMLIDFTDCSVIRFDNIWFKINLDSIKVGNSYSYKYSKSKSEKSKKGIVLKDNSNSIFTYEEYLYNRNMVSPLCAIAIFIIVTGIWLNSILNYKGYRVSIEAKRGRTQ